MAHYGLLFSGPLGLVQMLRDGLAASQGQLEGHPVWVVGWSVLDQILHVYGTFG